MKPGRWHKFQHLVLLAALAVAAQDAHALTFAPLVNYPTPSQLSGMACGDLDGDGNLDFVTANGSSNNFTVLMGRGDGTFKSVTSYALSTTPLYVALADFNGDGKLDLAITCYGSNDVKVLLGNGDGTFGSAASLSAGNNPRGIVVGDFNHDNQLDIAITNIMDNTVEVYLGNGDGTFQAGRVAAVGASEPGALVAADLNGDGKLDLVTSNYFSANCSVLLGNGDGTFAPAVTYAADSNPSSIAARDLNNDGAPDIVVSNHAGNVSVLIGNGDGTFKAQVKYAVGANPLRVVFDDFNHDGIPDVAVALYDDAKIAVLYGNGDGTFGTPVKFSVGAGSGELLVADLNHDGLNDLIVGQQNVPAVGVLLQTLTVTGLSVTPNAVLGIPPTQLVATLSSNANPASVTTSSVRLVRAGPDGVLGTADDVAITPNGVSVNGSQITVDLTGATLPNDMYRVMLQSSGGVAGVNGARLDGKFTGAFPSGDGTYADFTADFTLQRPTIWVTNMSPAPGTTLNSLPTSITVTTNVAPDPATVNVNTVKLVRAGPDGVFGTGDDVAITPAGVTTNGNGITVDLTGVKLPNDKYQIVLLSGSSSTASANGLAAYYKFDEGSGTVIHDSSGNGHNGTLTGGTWTSGIHGAALSFGPSNDVVNLGVADIPPPWTAAIWVKRLSDTPQASSQLTVRVPQGALKLDQYNQTRKVGITRFGSYDDSFNYSLPIGTWTHLTFVANSTTTSLYVNGALQDTLTASINMPMLQIGDSVDSANAVLDDFRVYNRALASQEISAVAGLGITDVNGVPLDGKFTDTFPSGDGTFANFNASFTLSTPKLTVTNLTPAPGAALTAPPPSIVATFSKPVDPASVNGSSVLLVRAGGDGQLGTADDVAITPHAIQVAGDGLSATVDLSGVKLPDDTYQLSLFSGNTPPSNGLAGYWKLDDGSGTIAADSSGNGNTGTLRNGATWAVGEHGGAIQLNGINQDIQVANSPSLDITGAGLTLAAWVYPTSNTNQATIIHKDFHYSMTMQPGGGLTYADSITWSFNSVGTYGNLPLNTWSHAAVTFDGSFIRFYINGVQVGSVARGGSISANSNPLYLGSYNGSTSYWPGKLDEERVYNRALSASEIAALARIGISDLNGNPLDGKFTGTFPSGDGTFANFNASFTVATPKLTVTGLTPAPNTTVVAPVTTITPTFSKPVDPATVNSATVHVIGAGPDGQFGTADDVAITPNSFTVAPDGLSASVDVTGQFPTGGMYQVTLGGGPAAISPGLVAYWKFDEGSGTAILDSSGNGINGALVGGATRVPGVNGGAIDFDGTDSYVNFGNQMKNLNVPLSFAAWVYRRGNAVVTTICSDDSPTTYYGFWMHIYDDNTLEISYGDGTGAAFPSRQTKRSTAAIADNTWTHIAAVIRGPGDMSLYINGVDAGGSYSGSGGAMVHSSDPLTLGHKSLGNTFIDANMDDVSVYSRALSQSEVAMLAALPPTQVADLNGNRLDGKFTGTFPSGDGTFAGFTANFRVDTAPVASAQSVSVHSNTALPITLLASDAENDPLTYTLVAAPAHGTLSGSMPNLTYTAGAYTGADSFSFKVNDGTVDSNIATVAITVTDTAPLALPGAAIVHSGAVTPVVIKATDAENDPLAYSLVTLPAHGTLTGTLPNLIYTADGYTGADTFTFKANDGVLDSNIATFTITVADNPPTVTAAASPASLLEFQQVSFTSTSSDPDGDALLVSWDFGDGTTATDANPAHAYAAAGTYIATVTVTDIGGLSAQASVVIHVYSQSDLPTARFVTSGLNGFVGQPVGFDATFSTDPDNNIVAYDWDFGDGSRHGSGQSISRVYTAPGTYTVTLTVTNGFGLSDATALTMVILPAGDAGLFPSALKYAVNWNRATSNADRIKLEATVNVGDIAVTSATPLKLGIVGESFSGTTGAAGSPRTGPTVIWKVRPGRKGSPKGTLEISATISHASIGAAFAKAGAIGATSKTLSLPVLLGVGGESFQASISSQFRFGKNGMQANGGGAGPR